MNEISRYWKVTASGKAFDFVNPTPDMIDAQTIIDHLTFTCRWGGNVETFYSVAQHSIIVADAIKRPDWRIYGLLHDAAEAYIGDLPTPFKGWLAFAGADIHGLERRILNCVWESFELPKPDKDIATAVDIADARALATEYRDIVKGRSVLWSPPAKPLPHQIRAKPWPDVADSFSQKLIEYLRIAKQDAP